jgi:hypothetical protein
LDPTRLGQHGRLERMGQIHEGVQALVIGGTSEPVLITSPDPVGLVRNELLESLSIPKFGGPGEFGFRQVWNGVSAENMRVSRTVVPEEQIFRNFLETMERRYPGAELIGAPQFADDQVNNTLILSAKFQVPEPATEKEGNWYVGMVPMNLIGAIPTSTPANRKSPVLVPAYPFDSKYSLEVQFPEDVSAVRDPAIKTIDGKHFAYSHTQAFRGNSAKVTIELRNKADRIEIAELEEFKRDFKALRESGSMMIIVLKGDIMSAEAPASFSERLQASIQEGLDKVAEAIQSGKLSGSDLAGAYIERSFSYSSLGKTDEALLDANQAVKLAPNQSRSFVARGYVSMLKGDFTKSIEDYSKAIRLGDADAENFRARGMAKLYSGQAGLAVEDS